MNIAEARQRWPHLKDYSDQELFAAAASQSGVNPDNPSYGQLRDNFLGYDRSLGEVAKDTGLQLGQGLLNVGSQVAALPLGYDNPVSSTLTGFTQDLDQFKSPGLQAQRAGAQINSDIAARQSAARGDDWVGQLGSEARAQVENYYNAPGLLGEDIVTNAPQLLVGGLVGRAVSTGARALSAGAQAARQAGVGAALGTSASMQGMDAGMDAYQRAVTAGASPEQAASLANEAALLSGGVSLGLSAMPWASAIERRLVGGQPTARLGLGRLGTAAGVTGAEMASEAVDEGVGQYASNLAVQTVDPSVDLLSGVGTAAVQGAAATGPIAGYTGLTMPLRPRAMAPAPTETGELDLTKAQAPAGETFSDGRGDTVTLPSDTPTALRRGLDPMNERSSPWAPPAPVAAPDPAPLMVTPDGQVMPMQSPDELAAMDAARAQQAAALAPVAPEADPASMVDLVGPAPTADAPTMVDLVQPAQRGLPANPFDAAGPAVPAVQTAPVAAAPAPVATPTAPTLPPVFQATQDGTVFPAQSPDQLAAMDVARAQQADPLLVPQRPITRGDVLRAIAAAKSTYTRADGELRGNAPMAVKSILEAPDPVAAIRLEYQNGGGIRDEFLDDVHTRLTGQDVAAWQTGQTQAPTPAVETPVATQPAAAPIAQPVAVQPAAQPAAQPTTQLTPVNSAPAAAQSAIQAGQKVKADRAAKTAKPKAPRYGNATSEAVARVANETKVPAEFNAAELELYKRWMEQGDETAETYFQENVPSESHKATLDAALAERRKVPATTRRSQALGEKFDASLESARRDPDNQPSQMAAAASKAARPLGQAQPLARAVMGATVSPEVERLLRRTGVDGATSLRQALHEIATSGPAPVRTLAAQLEKLMPSSGLTLTVDDTSEPPSHGDVALRPAPHLTLYTAGGRTGLSYDTLLHEALHVAVAGRYHTLTSQGTPVAGSRVKLAQFQQLWQGMRRMARGATGLDADTQLSLQSAAGNVDEFFVRSLTDPNLQTWMAGQPFAQSTMWDRFKSWVRSLLFGTPALTAQTSWLDAALTASQDVLTGMTVDAPRSAAPAATTLQSAMAEAPKPTALDTLGAAARSITTGLRDQVQGREVNPTMLKMLTLRQTVNWFGDKLPAMRPWVDAMFERDSHVQRLAGQADVVARQWDQAVPDKASRQALANILLGASVAEVSLDDNSPAYLATLDANQRADHTALRAKLATLVQSNPDVAKVRKDVLKTLADQWQYTRQALTSFINHTISDPSVRNQRIAQLTAEMGRNRGDYFPLTRDGDRVVIGRGAAADGTDVITFHESAASAQAEADRLVKAGVKHVVNTLRTTHDAKARASTGFMGDLHNEIDKAQMDPDAKNALHGALQQLYLRSLPELSGAKNFMKRNAVEGYSQDALRGFANTVTRGARYAAHLEYGPRIQAATEAMAAQARSSEQRKVSVVTVRRAGQAPEVHIVPVGTERFNLTDRFMAEDSPTTPVDVQFADMLPSAVEDYLSAEAREVSPEQRATLVAKAHDVVGKIGEGVEDLRAAQGLYNHLVERQASDSKEEGGPVVQALGQLGYTWFLGFTPAFWMMNMMQNPMIGIPHLGGRYGLGKASAEWGRAAGWFGGVRMGKLINDAKTPFSIKWLAEQNLKGITKQELAMLQRLEDRQVLDFTQVMDLTRIGQADGDTRHKFIRLAAAGAHHTEVFNRVTMALAAYRLALKSGTQVTHDDAMRMAENDVAATHFDYSFTNKPTMMRGPARLIFMFQQYRQHMLYWWANTIKDAVKGESKEVRGQAMRAAFLMGATNAVFAGALGMPFVGSIGFLLNLFGPDDDDGVPFDFERWVTQAAKEATGSDSAAQIMTKGIFTAVNANIGQRIGQADLLPFLNEGSSRFEQNADDKMKAFLTDLLGPLGSIAVSAAKSTEAFSRGDTVAGLALATPKAFADLFKAYGLHTEGLKTGKGQEIAGHEAFDGSDVFMQAIGVAPISVANMRADRGQVIEVDQAFKDTTRRLTDGFVQAWARQDAQGIKDALSTITDHNAQVARGKLADPGRLITGSKLETAIRNAHQRAMFLALTGGTADSKRQMLIALRMSGLINSVTPGTMNQGFLAEVPEAGD